MATTAPRAAAGRDAPAGIETPSGKGSGDENFPVASLLLPARLRPHVMAFYAFARGADDIADNPALAPADKLARLDLYEATLLGEAEAVADAVRLRASLAETGVTPRHAVDLLAAFKQDAVKQRYDDWPDLLAYCAKSASPVGRYLLDLHGERAADYEWSDGLCDALQVINHLQDCAKDHAAMDRVYLPQDWLAAAGADAEDLAAPAASPGLRRVLDQCLDGVDALMLRARRLPLALRSPGLACESGAIVALADRLVGMLRRQDPLATRVALGKAGALATASGGVIGTLLRRTLRAA